MADPDYVYNPDDWEATYSWDASSEFIEGLELDLGAVFQVGTLIQGPPKFLAHVVVTRDEAGDPEETEVRWFGTKEEAEAAVANPGTPAA